MIIRGTRMKELYFLEVDTSCCAKSLNRMIETIPPEKQEKLKKYRYDIDRKIGVYADILLRILILKACGINYNDIVIMAGKTGKPYFACTPHIEFSLSHTRNAVAIALSDRPVGIDVEKIRETDLRLAKDIFSEKELLWLAEGETNQYRRFYELWTKKEAAIKFEGIGLPDDLKSVDVTDCSAQKISTRHLGDYVVSVCSETDFSEIDIVSITEMELINTWRQYCLPDPEFINRSI